MLASAGWQPHTGLIDELALAKSLPSGLAYHASRHKWVPAPHLSLLTKKLVDLEQRRITRLIVEMPPRHGKSNLCSQYFPVWYLGRHPDHHIILASYEATFAQVWGERARDTMAEYGPSIFSVGVHPKRNKAADWRLAGYPGRMQCTGLAGGITGRGADLLIVDDPIKDAIEASSETYRARVWDWYTSTARTRLEPGAVVIVIQTRWHQEDLIGRLKQAALTGGEHWECLTLPAICEEDGDPLGREPGQPLWPARYNLAGLQTIQGTLPSHWWNALFQQRPTPPGGAIAKVIWFPVIEILPHKHIFRCRFWDCAGTEPGRKKRSHDPDWTVGALLARIGTQYYIEDIIRVRQTSGEVAKLIRHTAERDGPDVLVREEQEPGSAGLAVVEGRTTLLAGYNYAGRTKRHGKEIMWQPMLVQAEVGNFHVVRGDWNAHWFSEIADAPHGAHDDQLDAVSGAFSELSIGVGGLTAAEILSGGGKEDLDKIARRVF